MWCSSFEALIARTACSTARAASSRWPLWLAAAATAMLCALWGGRSAGAPASTGGWERSPSLVQLVARAASAKQRVAVLLVDVPSLTSVALERRLRQPAVQHRLQPLLRARYPGRSGEGRDVARRYAVSRLPTLLLLGTDGVELGRVGAGWPGGALDRTLARILAGEQQWASLERRVTAQPRSASVRLQVGLVLAHRGERRAEQQLRRCVELDRSAGRALAARALLALGQTLLLEQLGRPVEAEAVLRQLRKQQPASAQAHRALPALALALARRGRHAAALALLRGTAEPGRSLRLARFHRRSGWQLEQGIRWASQATRERPADPRGYEVLAGLQRALGRRAWRTTWRRALQLWASGPGPD